MTFPPLPTKGEVHLWLLEHQKGNSDLLSKEELARLRNYRFEKDQSRFAFTQTAKRIVLGRYLGLGPMELKFTENKFGKPIAAGLDFSISHTNGVSALAVSARQTVGVDIESITPQEDLTELTSRILSKSELTAFNAIPESEKLTAFYRLWCAKEAYLKNLGIGFAIEPDLIETHFPKFDSVKAAENPSKNLIEILWKEAFCLFLATDQTNPQVSTFAHSIEEIGAMC